MYYFAYGSNMNLAQMSFRIGANIMTPKDVGIIPNYNLEFKGVKELGYFATICPKENSQVRILIYDIDKQTENILDKAEGIDKGFYYKTEIKAKIHNEFIKGITYIMNDVILNKPIENGTPDDLYLARIIQAYKQLGIYENYIWECFNVSDEKKIKIQKLISDTSQLLDIESLKGANAYKIPYGTGWDLSKI